MFMHGASNTMPESTKVVNFSLVGKACTGMLGAGSL